ncbi:glutamine amidotransferase-related protein [Aestuariispira insulae]|uniref:GMP synthase-like glutamine amidotransferase n=1 Tax=Aestuariispira insulae TaxID=1461337 RepID=A0A3D9HWK2_9PROT|nr:gamma-glutamyl-gamma-aminobutyrate hydrolase family protein [Aestuariispira insulae]RED53795.1 GMP synthase-like glutamine amidotransferase [Aestuariispira insulae]
MHIGILETGRPSEDLMAVHKDYPHMCQRLLEEAGSDLEFSQFAVLDGELPKDPAQCDAWMITGSKFGVYEGHDWIERLKSFLRQAYDRDVPIIGICFGHQILAEALGGKVIKSDKGWGVGVHSYPIRETRDWMEAGKEALSIQAYHQDQIVDLPPDATVLAGTDFCPNAMLVYGNKALSFQGHPEFQADYAEDLIKARRGVLLAKDVADKALKTVRDQSDSNLAARWILNFLRDHQSVA